MDDLLPSYESATEQNPWVHIAEYLPSELLCTAALVCRKWHAIMTPLLWGKPASHFGVQNDTVYVALTRFKRALPYVRPFVRSLTHTLQFPPAHAEIYGGPHAEWLRDCLEYLPRLQCLIVNGLPFFDHASLLQLRYPSPRSKLTSPNHFPIFGLRLLDASRCTNATSVGLAEALLHFPDLISLDLSWTLAAKDDAVLDKLQYLRSLRVLGLRGLNLKDTNFSIIARTISTRVRSLDVSDNNLTDASARLLLEHCLKDTPIEHQRNRGPQPPLQIGQIDGEIDTFSQESLIGDLRKKLTRGFMGRLAIEDASDMGITHLYLTKNAVTVEGISGLIRSRRLQVLDIGEVPATWEKPCSIISGDALNNVKLPGVSKLTPILSEYATRLQYLRVNCELIIDDAPIEALAPNRAELSNDIEPSFSPQLQEVGAIYQPQFELGAVDSALVELPGESSCIIELPNNETFDVCTSDTTKGSQDRVVSGMKPDRSSIIGPDLEQQVIKRGGVFAPEVVSLDSPLLSPSIKIGNYQQQGPSLAQHMEHLLEPKCPVLSSSKAQSESTHHREGGSRHNSAHYVEDRRARLDLRYSRENCLHPGMLPELHTLVLTNVPGKTTDKRIITRLVQYIKDAAEEASIARQRARLTYCLPPGRSRVTAEQEYTQSLFALRRIVFEMAPPLAPPKKATSSWRVYPTKSSTEDADTEAFWDAATHDFSFFGDEECGLPTLEPGRTLPLAAMSGLELALPQSVPSKNNGSFRENSPLLDVISEIGRFRKDKRAAYESLIQRGDIDSEVDGYWPGEITVVKKSLATDAGQLDCYGNRYEAGWYYR